MFPLVLNLILIIVFISILLWLNNFDSFKSHFYDLWTANVYDISPYRAVIISPFNWVILNDVATGQIFTFDSNVYKCPAGSMAVYIFKDVVDSYEVRCWGGTQTNILALVTASNTIPYKVTMTPPQTNETYTIVDAINNLLDLGVITNTVTI
jgi:hypothetical protein